MNKEKMDDDLVDDVFEEDDPKNYYQNVDTGLNINEAPFFDDQTPSPTSRHPAFRNVAAKSNTGLSSDFDDGWKSFKIVDDNGFDESVLHKVGMWADEWASTHKRNIHSFARKNIA